MNNELETKWKEAVVGGTNLAGLRKNTRTSADNQSPEHEREVLLIQPQWSVNVHSPCTLIMGICQKQKQKGNIKKFS